MINIIILFNEVHGKLTENGYLLYVVVVHEYYFLFTIEICPK